MIVMPKRQKLNIRQLKSPLNPFPMLFCFSKVCPFRCDHLVSWGADISGWLWRSQTPKPLLKRLKMCQRRTKTEHFAEYRDEWTLARQSVRESAAGCVWLLLVEQVQKQKLCIKRRRFDKESECYSRGLAFPSLLLFFSATFDQVTDITLCSGQRQSFVELVWKWIIGLFRS